MKKLKLKLGIHFWNKACFSVEARKTLVASPFLPMLDYGDLLYMNASVQCFHMLGTVYYSALRFLTGFKMHTHTLRLTGSLCLCRGTKIASHLYWSSFLVYFHFENLRYFHLRLSDLYVLSVPKVRTELGKMAFGDSVTCSWNSLQAKLKLENVITLDKFKKLMKELEAESTGNCLCFWIFPFGTGFSSYSRFFWIDFF